MHGTIYFYLIINSYVTIPVMISPEKTKTFDPQIFDHDGARFTAFRDTKLSD